MRKNWKHKANSVKVLPSNVLEIELSGVLSEMKERNHIESLDKREQHKKASCEEVWEVLRSEESLKNTFDQEALFSILDEAGCIRATHLLMLEPDEVDKICVFLRPIGVRLMRRLYL